MRDQILEDSIVAFTLANLKNLYLRVVLNFDFWAMVQLAFHGVLQIGFPFYKFEYEIIGVPWVFKVSAEFHGGKYIQCNLVIFCWFPHKKEGKLLHCWGEEQVESRDVFILGWHYIDQLLIG